MRDGVFCNFNLFDYHQTIQMIKDDVRTNVGLVETSELGKAIGKYCLANNIDYVRLIGDKMFANKIIADIDKQTGNLYSEKKIEIEVN